MPLFVYKIGAIFLVISALYFYYTSTQSKIEELTASASKYKEVAKDNQHALDTMIKQYLQQDKAIEKLNKRIKITTYENAILEKKLSKHNLEYLAYKKPKLIEKRINDATKKVFSDLSNISDY